MKYNITATGRVYAKTLMVAEENARFAVADMLRYDDGEITKLEVEPSGQGWSYTAHITCEHYTKERWDSFMIKTAKV